MDRVDEIEAAIDRLPQEEFRRIADWIHAREQRQWDEQLDSDSASGKLNFLFEEAEDKSNSPHQFVQKSFRLGRGQDFRWDKALALGEVMEDEDLSRKLS